MVRTFFALIVIMVSGTVSAQFSRINPELFTSQIHLVDEFMERFNERIARADLQEEYANDQKANILLLFDLAIFKSKEDSLFLKAEEFSERVISDSVQICYEDSTWYAKALCHGVLQKKPVDFILYLRIGKTAIGRHTWFIEKAEGEIFDLTSKKEHKPFVLMPNDHETDFMSLHRLTSDTPDFITDFMANDCLDQTAVFMTLVKTNLLKIEHVKDLEFVFNQVPGYQFSIKYVMRENLNSGWLINSFTKL